MREVCFGFFKCPCVQQYDVWGRRSGPRGETEGVDEVEETGGGVTVRGVATGGVGRVVVARAALAAPWKPAVLVVAVRRRS